DSDATTALQYSLNGGSWQSYSNPDGQNTYGWHTLHIPLAPAALRAGANTLALRASNGSDTVVSEGDPPLNLADTPYPAPAAPRIPCSLMQLMMLAMPNMTMASAPCAGGTPLPSLTPRPTDTSMPLPSTTPGPATATSTSRPATNTPVPPTTT